LTFYFIFNEKSISSHIVLFFLFYTHNDIDNTKKKKNERIFGF